MHSEKGAEKTGVKYITGSDAVQLGLEDTSVNLQVSGALTVTLPPVAQAKGLTFTVFAQTATAAVTLEDKSDSQDWEGDFTLDAANDYVVLRSDGLKWYVTENQIA